jgi:hypothetical protein
MDPEDIKTVVSVVALVVSVMALVISMIATGRTAVAGRRPVLIFDYDSERGWRIRNVGNGPALNVIVAQKKDGEWFDPTRIPPLAKDAEYVLRWCLHVNDTGLGSTYTDVADMAYTSSCGNDLSTTRLGHHLPRWSEPEIRRDWKL